MCADAVLKMQFQAITAKVPLAFRPVLDSVLHSIPCWVIRSIVTMYASEGFDRTTWNSASAPCIYGGQWWFWSELELKKRMAKGPLPPCEA